MLSIKALYNIGRGPSSSHTMGPAKACQLIKERFTYLDRYEVVLYNSFALTGKGHLTEEAITETLHPLTVSFSTAIDVKRHPNTMIVKGFFENKLIVEKEIQSIGGGRIVFIGEEEIEQKIYPHHKFKEIKRYCLKNKMSLYEYVKMVETNDIDLFLKSIWEQMNSSIEKGLQAKGVLPGPLKMKRKAFELYHQNKHDDMPELTENRLLSSYAFAVSEENASGGMVVTAPTCGACGVLPAVLYYLKGKYNFISDQKVIEALAVAGLIGNLIKYNASISGAVAGCQAEIGSACSMAAAAHATLFDLTIDQVEYAAEVAMEHHLGLTCDPVNGFVQIPCIERNAVAALRAVDASRLSYYLSDFGRVSFDTVIETMYQTGLDMHTFYKETSQGGLAKHFKEDDNDVNCW